ncbi:MAG: hypothetical protein MJ110_05875 [Lachnospiraceae bacterium]|nr:hypothetical protein [Lachnospiraceae bacterium]
MEQLDIQGKVEQNLREMHQALSRAEKYGDDNTMVIVNRNQMLSHLKKISSSIYDLLDKYEMTSVGKDRARREMEREKEEIEKQAKKQAEDIYAGAVMYTDNALNGIIERIEESKVRVTEIFDDLQKEMQKEEEVIRNNKLDLQSQLQILNDTKVYMMAIEEANKKIAQELGEMEADWDDEEIDYANAPYAMDPDAIIEKSEREKMLEQMADAEYFKRQGETEPEAQEKKKGLFHRKEKKK